MGRLQLRVTPKFYVLEERQNSTSNAFRTTPTRIDNCFDDNHENEEPKTSATNVGAATPAPKPKPTVELPIMSLLDLLRTAAGLRQSSSNGCPRSSVVDQLWTYLYTRGYVVLSVPVHSKPGTIIQDLKNVIDEVYFPTQNSKSQSKNNGSKIHLNSGSLQKGTETYVSERHVPMYKLGYELLRDDEGLFAKQQKSNDGEEEPLPIREVYRVHAGAPDRQPWPTENEARRVWLRAMCLCRYICDAALELTLGYPQQKQQNPVESGDSPPTLTKMRRRRRLGSSASSWGGVPNSSSTAPPYYTLKEGQLPDREGDYSVMYAMHYFNHHTDHTMESKEFNTGSGNDSDLPPPQLAVKEHVDPSLFVLEPYLADVEGLQVYDWMNTSMSSHPNENTNGSSSPKQEKQSNGHDENDTEDKRKGRWITCDGPTSIVRQSMKEGDMAMILFVGRAFASHCPQQKNVCSGAVKPTLHRVVEPPPPPPLRDESDIGGDGGRRTVIYEQKYEEYFPPPLMD